MVVDRAVQQNFGEQKTKEESSQSPWLLKALSLVDPTAPAPRPFKTLSSSITYVPYHTNVTKSKSFYCYGTQRNHDSPNRALKFRVFASLG